MSSKRMEGMPLPVKTPKGKLTFGALPLELQQQIVRRMSRKDLFVFQRLSSNCLALASAEIYQKLDLKLSNSGEEDDVSNSHAADTLHTILASEHNYGKHIKSFRLEAKDDATELALAQPSRSDPLLMTRFCWDSKSDSSKFLNTALLLVARKTSKLETFQWDVPIEISGAVYQALHKIENLRHLRVRLDVSPSPKMVIRHGLPSHHHPATGANPIPTTQQFPNYVQSLPPVPGIAPTSSGPHPGQSTTKSGNVKRKKFGGSGGYSYWANPRTFSGFRHLNTLSLVAVSNLDCLGEIAECIKASSATLKCLTLTLSTDLARKARKPASVNPDTDDPSDTELEDDELMNDPLMPPTTTATTQPPPTNEADIRKERLAQESILATVFGLQSVALEGKKLEKKLSLWDTAPNDKDSELFTREFSLLMKTLLDEVVTDAGSASSAATLDRFKIIKEVADMYLTNQNMQKKALKEHFNPQAPSTKKPDFKSKPLNPLASDFKAPVVITDLPPGGSKWDNYFSGVNSANLSLGSPSASGTTMQHPYPGFLNGDGLLSTAAKSKTYQPYKPMPLPQSHWNHNTEDKKQHQESIAKEIAELHEFQKLYAQTVQKQKQLEDQMQASPLLPLPFKPHPPDFESNGWSGDFIDGMGSSYLDYPSSANGPSLGSPLISSDTPEKVQSGPSKAKAKASKPKKKIAQSKAAVVADSDDETDPLGETPGPSTKPFFAAETSSGTIEEAMDVDMEHPDEETQELGEDQEILPEAEDNEVHTPRKRAKTGSIGEDIPLFAPYSESSPIVSQAETEARTVAMEVTSEEEMQAYVRKAHGLHLTTLALEWVPLKPSIVARALDLSVLKHITLLEVGSQDAFWTLLTRLQVSTPGTAFKSIHTDNVSGPFLKFLGTFEGLEELYMHERAIKQGEDAVATASVSITLIRKLALQRHISSLKRLMLRNERNEQWDVDRKTLQFMGMKGKDLRELAMSLNMKTYHVLMQLFGAFKNLYALHLTALRSTDRNAALQNESLSFAADNFSHCRDMKLRYLSIANNVITIQSKLEQYGQHVAMVMKRRKDKKGKGKSKEDASMDMSYLLDNCEGSGSDDDIVAELMAVERQLRTPTFFHTVHDVKIFTTQMRFGRL